MRRSNTYLGNVSDLMAGLMIVFLFIAISYMIEVTAREGEVKERAVSLETALSEVTGAKTEAEFAKVEAEQAKEGAEQAKEEAEQAKEEAEQAKEEAEQLNKTLEKQRGQLLRTNETIREIAASYSEIQGALYERLTDEFSDDLPKWNATLERDNTIRFNEPDVLFLTGKAEIRDRFKDILNDFYPRYLNIIYTQQFKGEIEEIRIEGHTSSAWKDSKSPEDRYLKNADLSQQRALEVLSYCFQLPAVRTKQTFLIRDMRANGLSFARPILNDEGAEDALRSQRVEFRVVTKTQARILRILEAGNVRSEEE